MKALATLTAAVALIAGISIANVANAAPANNSTNKVAEVIGTSQYCTKAKTGELICNYASLNACKSGAKSGSCISNPQSGTGDSG